MNLSMKQIWGATAAAAAVLIVIWYLAVFSPQKHQLANAHRSYTAAAQQVAQLDQQISQLEVVEKQLPADNARLKVLDAAVPHTEDLQDVLVQLHSAATSSGVELTTVSPSAAVSTSSSATGSAATATAGGTQQISMGLSISGSFAQVMAFMTDLMHLQRVVVVDTATFSPSTGSTISSSLTTRIFYAA